MRASPIPCAGRWPLVDRHRELSAVDKLRHTPGIAAVGLSGPAGAGTSRVLAESLRRAADEGANVEAFAASPAAASVPLGAFARLVSGCDRTGDRFELFVTVIERLERAGRRLVVGIDDAQHLDPAGAALVQQIALSRRAFLILSLRAGSPMPVPIRTLWSDGPGRLVPIRRFDARQLDRLVAGAVGGPLDAGSGLALWRATGGNLTVLHRVLEVSLACGALFETAGVWCWRGLGHLPPLPDLADPELGRLADGERTALELVSLAGSLELAALDLLVDGETLDALGRKGLLAAEYDGRRRRAVLARPIDAHLLRASLTPWRERTLRLRIGSARRALPRRRHDDGVPAGPSGRGGAPPATADLARLTPRERTVVTLAASGLTNREVASRLHVSLRTIENHLYRAFPKLGVSSRRELSELSSGPLMTGAAEDRRLPSGGRSWH